MFIKIVLSACIAVSSISFASEMQSDSAYLGSDGSSPKSITSMANSVSAIKSEPALTGSWLHVESKANGTTKWRTNVRFDNAPSQTIEYVVNCQDRSVALSSFGVQTDTGTKVFSYDNRLSFYKPSMVIDSNLVASTCNNRVAMNGMAKPE
jgi:hypothetical protein